MKKVFLTLVAMATMGVANAQLFVGGDFGFSVQNGKYEQTATGVSVTQDLPKTISWEITPKIGFQMYKLSIGAAFGISQDKRVRVTPAAQGEDKAAGDVTNTVKTTMYGITPFARYNVLDFGNLSMFCELQIPIWMGQDKNKTEIESVSSTEVDGTKYFDFGLNIIPGLSYNLNDHISMDCYLNLLSIGYNMSKETDESADGSKEISKTNEIEFGVKSLPSLIAVGFNWKF